MYRRTRQEQTDIYSPEQVRRVLAISGVKIENEVDSDYIIFCPYHANYRTPAGEVSKEHGTFFCFSCHESRNLTELLMHLTKKSFFEVGRVIDSAKVSTNIIDSVDKMLEEKQEYIPFDEVMIKRLNNQALESPRATSYFEGRRISRSSMEKFSLGFSENQDMVTIPVQNPDGSLYVGFIGRSVEGKDFRNTNGLPKSKVLFNLHRAKRHDSVYIVESSFDAIRLDQCGVPAIATLGVYISKFQLDLLTKYFNNVIVIQDNDDAGRTLTDKIVNRMKDRATVVGLPQRFKDIGDMTDADIQELTKRVQDPLLAMYL